MKRHLTFIFILERVLDRRPEIHRHGTDLDLRLNLFRPVYGFYCIINDQVIASVTTLFDMLEIIFLTLDRHIGTLLDHGCYCINIFFKLADNTDSRDILQFFFHMFHKNVFALHFFQDARHTLDTSADLFDRRIEVILLVFVYNMLKLDHQFSDRQFIGA